MDNPSAVLLRLKSDGAAIGRPGWNCFICRRIGEGRLVPTVYGIHQVKVEIGEFTLGAHGSIHNPQPIGRPGRIGVHQGLMRQPLFLPTVHIDDVYVPVSFPF